MKIKLMRELIGIIFECSSRKHVEKARLCETRGVGWCEV